MKAALAFVLVAVSLVAPPAATASELGCLPGRPGALLVSYSRTGGFAGIRERLRVYRGGRAEVVRGSGALTELRLSCRCVRALRDALVAARFASLATVYAPDAPVADGFLETVAYGGRSVRVLTGAELPPRLARALAVLRDVVSRRR